jgi:hypothetical protein
MSDEETKDKLDKQREYQRRYAQERRDKGEGWDRYIYVPCRHQDCKWIEAKLEEYRQEVKDATDTNNDQT